MRTQQYLLFAVTLTVLLSSCGADKNSTGVEYAPAMYHSVPYEPYTQVTKKQNEYYNTIPDNVNNNGSNLLKPVSGTVSRRVIGTSNPNYNRSESIMVYNIHPDSIEYASRVLTNPLPDNEKIRKQGEELYIRFCAACHGNKGAGDGKVAPQYKGVPAGYNKGRYATLTEGHIFHTITYGKGRMWPHGSQIPVEDRWKIVKHVQELQKL